MAAPQRDGRGEVPWGGLDAAAVFFLSVVLIGLVSPVLSATLGPDLAEGVFFPLSLALLGATAVVWVRVRYPGHVALLLRRRPTAGDAAMGLAHGVAAFFAINVGFALVLQLVAGLTGFEVPEVQQGLREAIVDGRIGVLVILSVVVVAPVAEELFYRGLLFQGLRGPLGHWPAVVASAVLFGLSHYQSGNIAGTLYALVVLSSLGAYLAWALQRRSLVTPIVMHATFNAMAVGGLLLGG